jgi:signal transduction histidine kinase
VAAGVVLIAATYGVVSWSLAQSIQHRADLVATHGAAAGGAAGVSQAVREGIEAYRTETLGTLLTLSSLALGVALVLAVALGWVVAGRALRPLRQITETADRVAHRSLHERIALDGPRDEVKELADTIDAMLERLDRSFDAQRRFVANASHELRTPLAVTRTLLEVALSDANVCDDLRQLAPALLATNERSERLIEGLLTLARSEHEITDRTALDLADVAAVAVEQERPEALERAVKLSTDLRPAPVDGSRVLVERVAANLVQNAVRHSPRGADAIVRTGRKDGQSILQVENPGRVLHPYEIERLFEPFQRGEGRTNTGGVGLGLSIARSVASAHGGSVTAYPRDGGGLVVRVALPTRDG